MLFVPLGHFQSECLARSERAQVLLVCVTWQWLKGLLFSSKQVVLLSPAYLAGHSARVLIAAIAEHQCLAHREDATGWNHIAHARPDLPSRFIHRRHTHGIGPKDPVRAMPPVIVQESHRRKKMRRPNLQIVSGLEINLQVAHIHGFPGHRQDIVQHATQIYAASRLISGFRIKTVHNITASQIVALFA